MERPRSDLDALKDNVEHLILGAPLCLFEAVPRFDMDTERRDLLSLSDKGLELVEFLENVPKLPKEDQERIRRALQSILSP